MKDFLGDLTYSIIFQFGQSWSAMLFAGLVHKSIPEIPPISFWTSFFLVFFVGSLTANEYSMRTWKKVKNLR